MYAFEKFEQLAKKTLTHVEQEINSLRTGGASPQLLDNVRVEVYETQLKVAELAVINAPDPSSLIITPWDQGVIEAIVKAIYQAELNLNPIIDGKIIRINIPPLTEESRRNLVKILKQKIEDGRVLVRNLRAEIKKEIEKQKGTPGISEDDIEQDLASLETKIKELGQKIEQLGQNKEVQLLKV